MSTVFYPSLSQCFNDVEYGLPPEGEKVIVRVLLCWDDVPDKENTSISYMEGYIYNSRKCIPCDGILGETTTWLLDTSPIDSCEWYISQFYVSHWMRIAKFEQEDIDPKKFSKVLRDE